MLVAVFSTVSPFNYTKRISSYREELVSLSEVLESFLQSHVITYKTVYKASLSTEFGEMNTAHYQNLPFLNKLLRKPHKILQHLH